MGERKVLNKYIPSDFDPKLVPRGTKPKDDLVTVRMMLPFTIQCSTCSTVSFVAVWSLYHFLLVFRRSPSIRLFSPPPHLSGVVARCSQFSRTFSVRFVLPGTSAPRPPRRSILCTCAMQYTYIHSTWTIGIRAVPLPW